MIAEGERTLFSDPWSQRALTEHLQSPIGIGYLALFDGQPAAYLIASLGFGQGEILRIGTLPEYRRRGLGQALVERFLAEAAAAECEAVFLEVRRGNEAARALYEAAGFLTVGERRGYYSAPREDAILYQKKL